MSTDYDVEALQGCGDAPLTVRARRVHALLGLAFAAAVGTRTGPDPRAAGAADAASAPPATYSVGARPRAIATGDLDGDRRLDVIVANSGAGTLTVLLGAASGRLGRTAEALPAGREPSDVDAADLDRDGDLDLVVANHETSGITVLINDGNARFDPASGSPYDSGASPHLHGLATGDFDGDGWLDVAVDSAGTKAARVLRGGPSGLGAAVSISIGTTPYYRLGAADVTGDGVPDILAPGHGDNSVRVVHRRGARLALAPWRLRLSGKPWMAVGDDVNGDRRMDIVVVESDAASVWLAGRGGFFPAPGSPFAVRGATEVATGDLDGDRVADVAIGPWEGDEITVLAGRKPTPRRVRACERPIGLAIADLDGDRRGELLTACPTDDRLLVLSLSPGR